MPTAMGLTSLALLTSEILKVTENVKPAEIGATVGYKSATCLWH